MGQNDLETFKTNWVRDRVRIRVEYQKNPTSYMNRK